MIKTHIYIGILVGMLLLPIVTLGQNDTILRWTTLNQKHTIKKDMNYDFVWGMPKTKCLYIEMEEAESYDEHTFTLLTRCVPPPPDWAGAPDTIVVGCGGETVYRTYKNESGTSSKSDDISTLRPVGKKTIRWQRFGQRDTIPNCTVVDFIFSNEVTREDADFVYESIDGGFVLEVKKLGERVIRKFDCVCKVFQVSIPESISFEVAENLRYEQIIWTPQKNNIWEVRIGTTEDRKCKSSARSDLKELRSKEYEKNVPRCK